MDEVPELAFKEVTSETWLDFERLFESRGAPKYCWCMVWRNPPPGEDKSSRPNKKRSIEKIIKSGTPVGIIGYIEGEPTGWCSIAPKPTYRSGIGGIEVPNEPPESVWSIACFFVPRRLRGLGIGEQLLHAVVDHAGARGAKSVEAYPVDPDSPSYLFMGFVPMFERAGFKKVGTAGTRRQVMRLQLD